MSSQVLVIVPAARHIPFLFECDAKGRQICAWVRGYRKAAKSDAARKWELAEFCERVLDGRPLRDWDRRDRSQIDLMQQVAVASLEVENLDLFDRAMRDASTPLPDDAYQSFGRLMAQASDVDAVQTR